MKTSSILAAAALSFVAVTGAQAETYQGVAQPVSANSRAAVNAEAVRAASAPDQNVPLGSRGPVPFTSTADAAKVRAEAVATAHAPDQNVASGSKYNSRVISTMQTPDAATAQASK
jgi:hypothetical protein